MKILFISVILCFAFSTFAQNTKQSTIVTLDCTAMIYETHIHKSMNIEDGVNQKNNYCDFNDNKDILQQYSNAAVFQSFWDSTNMIFEPPKDYIEIEPIENRQMNYEKAYKHPNERFEVRYAIRNNKFNISKQIFEMTVLNISGGQLPEYTLFGTESVKKEFGADVGATVVVEVCKEFGQDYKYCLIVFIHKNGVGDGYIFYLADNKELISNLMMPIFHALRFK
mgnify:CR=1 FL=1